ncbi:hypothetical protein C500_04189 [Natrialba magadii ATCC 43099]|uniref:Uncharacterized protein n=1 Tax=Natrialba magadii (strain ATCC 43099 / DSM 3394 / CCM 3739 / CIP 104546 / IAM 13178 / JCM 8861 / NBRC 102185 / NCIMB 2190 / MS3) TaxID=547559 RepID=L9V5H9_NATMM|nr:hypothetical protein C500_04189 [Natrialba magadii ATCC 43099]
MIVTSWTVRSWTVVVAVHQRVEEFVLDCIPKCTLAPNNTLHKLRIDDCVAGIIGAEPTPAGTHCDIAVQVAFVEKEPLIPIGNEVDVDSRYILILKFTQITIVVIVVGPISFAARCS